MRLKQNVKNTPEFSCPCVFAYPADFSTPLAYKLVTHDFSPGEKTHRLNDDNVYFVLVRFSVLNLDFSTCFFVKN